MKIDLHLHTACSDGTDTPSRVVALAKERGLDIIAITDHDTVSGLDEAHSALPSGMRLIDGIELTCEAGEGGFLCHILGYGIDRHSSAICELNELARLKRYNKQKSRLEHLRARHGIVFDASELAKISPLETSSKRHLGALIVERGLADSINEAIQKYLFGDEVPDFRIDAATAISAIKRGGGIPIWAHPLGGEDDGRLTGKELIRRVDTLVSLGLMGLECFYSRYTASEESLLLSVAKSRSLLVSGGSDYHGKNKTVELGCLSSDGSEADVGKITVIKSIII